ncbi:hypothetical protein ACGFRG_12820 [Streptomyces sp. NPDC048696]|uniref:hypothetical protein n=1 Tax=Streptomyces sp. NPDC048696 TaxID=3365585 RepID=UPI00371385EF
MTALADTAAVLKPSARHLVPDASFVTAVHIVQRCNAGLHDDMASRIVDEALKFLAAAATNRTPGFALRPSRIADEGWHALLWDTKTYESLCAFLGRFIHHVPESPATKKHDTATVDRTLAAIRSAGYLPDDYLWAKETQNSVLVAADCMHSECTDGGSNCAAPEAN